MYQRLPKPSSYPVWIQKLHSRAEPLAVEFKQGGEGSCIEEAIDLDREALQLCPPGHPRRLVSLTYLACHLLDRYDQLGATSDFEEAITLDQEALHLCPQGHPERSMSLNGLANGLLTQYKQFGRTEDLDQAIVLNQEALDLFVLSARYRQIVGMDGLDEAIALGREALDLRPQGHPNRSTSLNNLAVRLFIRYNRLGGMEDLDEAIFLGREALDLCPQGHPDRSLYLANLAVGLYTRYNQLRSMEDLDEAIVLSRDALNLRPQGHPLLSMSLINLAVHLSTRYELLGGKEDLDEAIVLDREALNLCPQGHPDRSTSLNNLAVQLFTWYNQLGWTEDLEERTKRVDVTRELADFLRKLWDQIVSPIVDFLRTTHPSQSRIWWCPTAEFSVLPFHAAGPFRKGQRNLPDIYVSSYTPTLSALIRARHRDPSSYVTQQKRFIAIGQAKATGESELVSVGAELHNIELGKNDWVHLACHGLPNPKKPFESAFALRDGHLTIERIIRCDLKNLEFAHLSACHTTVGDEESPDEAIHLASAMQFAGFRSVIGTMWAVDDGETNKITSRFYRYMVDESDRLDHARTAFALNKTMKSVDVPFDQRILYVHLGA
ncbi:CHAT domain-containing protein [Boletus coccyginus]|nr:CHAT domain-containing protein [Boletus coccyginus]